MTAASKISELSLRELRNLTRGAISNTSSRARASTINHARRILTLRDAPVLASIMCSTDLDHSYFGPQFSSSLARVFAMPNRQEIDLDVELAFQVARLDAYLDVLREPAAALGDINTAILTGQLGKACSLSQQFMINYGYSATLARKVIYLYSKTHEILGPEGGDFEREHSAPLLSEFMDTNEHTLYSQFFNLSLDVCDASAPCLEVMRDHRRIFERFSFNSNISPRQVSLMRRVLYPTHYSALIDPHSLLYLSSSSALDLLIDITVTSYSDDIRFACLHDLFRKSRFLEARAALQPNKGAMSKFLQLPHIRGEEEAAYKASFAFPEVERLALWRRSIDFEFSYRTDGSGTNEPAPYKYFVSGLSLRQLCKPAQSTLKSLSRFRNSQSGIFLRTVAVLNRLRHGERLSDLSSSEVRLLLSITTEFARILTENELLDLKQKAERDEERVIVFLSMVMLNTREPSEDLAFELRLTFQFVVLTDFDSQILKFFDWIHQRTPGLSRVIVELCDISFLERLYLLHETYSDVLTTREEICRWAAHKLDSADYVAVAERLALDAKVRSIRGQIDENRIFVDTMRYEQWASDALASSIRKFERVISVAPISREEADGATPRTRAERASRIVGNDYWLRLACEEAFREFCHNRIFGIDSYLSRRIRHGTLAGTLIVPIQELIAEFRDSHSSQLSPQDVAALDRCLDDYKSAVYVVRDKLLHFNGSEHPEGLLLPYHLQTPSRARLYEEFRELIVDHLELGFGSRELCSLFSDHCWDLLNEDLLRVQSELRRFFYNRVRPVLRNLDRPERSRQAWKQLVTELDQRAEGLFASLLRWFTRSEGSTMTVTVGELLNVVVDEVGTYWPSYKRRFTLLKGGEQSLFGSSYQNVYDLLTVLFSNIAQHGDPEAETTVESGFGMRDDMPGSSLRVVVVSDLRPGTSDESVRKAIAGALAADHQRDSMIREGRSGLGKMRTLIESYSDRGRFSWSVDGGRCRMEFEVPIILVGSE